MLSERERRTLNDIERQIGTEDPDLARCLIKGVPRREQPRRWPSTVGLVLALLSLAVSIVLALPGVAAVAVVLATALAVRRWRQSRACCGVATRH